MTPQRPAALCWTRPRSCSRIAATTAPPCARSARAPAWTRRLIARYFDGKEGLYLAALADEQTGPPKAPIETGDLVEATRLLFEHWDERGMSPAMRALIGSPPNAVVRDQVRTILGAAITGPLTERLAERGLSQPERRAELLLAVMVGAELLRRNGVLPAMDGAPTDELLELLEPIADALQR